MKQAKRKPCALQSQDCQKDKQMTVFWIKQEGSKCCYHFNPTIWHNSFLLVYKISGTHQKYF